MLVRSTCVDVDIQVNLARVCTLRHGACRGGADRDTLNLEVPLLEGSPMTYRDEGSAPAEDHGFLIAVTIIGFMIVVAALLALYFLLWDGGGNMS
jgi:hypothetical protein